MIDKAFRFWRTHGTGAAARKVGDVVGQRPASRVYQYWRQHGTDATMRQVLSELGKAIPARELAFGRLDLDYEQYVVQDERYFRPAEVDLLVGDAAKAHKVLEWEPTTSFPELVTMMVDADFEQLSKS